MSRLSVSSSNSLRRSSPSARKRANSLGQLGEVAEDESYEYEALSGLGSDKTGGGSTYWQDRIRQVRSESPSARLSGALQRAKSICEVGAVSEATPPMTPQRTGVIGAPGEQYARSDGAGLRQKAISCSNTLQHVNTNSTPHLKLKPTNHLPDLLSSFQETPRRPHSTYDLKVRRIM